MPDEKQIATQISALYGGIDWTPSEAVVIWQLAPRDDQGRRKVRRLGLPSPADADAVSTLATKAGDVDVYLDWTPVDRDAISVRASKKAITRAHLLAADIDCVWGDHASSSSDQPLPDLEVAIAWIDTLSELAQAEPAALLDTGGGFHVWWRLPQPITDPADRTRLYTSWARAQEALAHESGCEADLSCAKNPASGMRVAGTKNSKYQKRKVDLISLEDLRQREGS